MFKNLILFRVRGDWTQNKTKVETALEAHPFIPCSGIQKKSCGWVPLQKHGEFVTSIDGDWIADLMVEKKTVPGAIVKKETEERVKNLSDRLGKKLPKKAVNEIKEEVLRELLPRAFAKQEVIRVWISTKLGIIGVNASTTAKSDEVMAALNKHIDGFAAARINTEKTPSAAMADWLCDGEAPGEFDLDRECELKGVSSEKPSVKYSRLSLEREEIKQHIAELKMPVAVSMTYAAVISFSMTDKMVFKKLKISIPAPDKEGGEFENLLASLAIETGELSKLVPDIIAALGGEIEAAEQE